MPQALVEKYRPSHFPPVRYTEEEHETWSILIRRFAEMIPDHMCQEYLDAYARMDFPVDRIPSLAEVEKQLRKFSDWRIARAGGIVPDEDFYGLFAAKAFPANDFIRSRADIDYTPAPDIFHELVGHVPALTDPALADFTRKLGDFAFAVSRRHGAKQLVPLARIYWFTLEFGLMDTAKGVKIFGAGFAPGEMRFAATDAVEKRPFRIDEVAMTAYSYWEMQKKLFVIDGFEDLNRQFDGWIARFDPATDWGDNPKGSGGSAA